MTLQLSVFGPHTIYSGNEAEFTASFWALERHLLLAAAAIFAALCRSGYHLPGDLAPCVRLAALRGRHRPVDSSESPRCRLRTARWQRNRLDAFTTGGISTRLRCGRPCRRRAVLAAKQGRACRPVCERNACLTLQAALVDRHQPCRPSAGTHGVAGAVGGDVRVFRPGRTLSHRSRRVPFRRLRAKSSTPSARRSDGLLGVRVLRGSRRRVSDDHGEHPGDADGNRLSPGGAAPARTFGNHFTERLALHARLRSQGYRVDSVTEMRFDNKSATNFFRMPRPYVSLRRVHAICGLAACRPFAVQACAAHPARPWHLQRPGMATSEVVRPEPRAASPPAGVITRSMARWCSTNSLGA